jgi:hypothetical protein
VPAGQRRCNGLAVLPPGGRSGPWAGDPGYARAWLRREDETLPWARSAKHGTDGTSAGSAGGELAAAQGNVQTAAMTERFERHRQPWTPAEIQKLHHLASKGASLAAICKALTRSEESVKIRAKLDKLLITKKR